MKSPDVCIAGAGIVGLTLALALLRRGVSVRVLSAGDPMSEASTAAAGMLAVDDPDNPRELHALATFSRSLYPALLESLNRTAHAPVSFQTHRTLQALTAPHDAMAADALPLQAFLPHASPGGSLFAALQEESLDPRELAPALIRTVLASTVELWENSSVVSVADTGKSVLVRTATEAFEADHFIDCTGAWSLSTACMPWLRVAPRKGQMLTVPTPASLASGIVLRSERVYVVPRLRGPNAGAAVVGATVEDAGFDRSVDSQQIRTLLGSAAELLPELRSSTVLSSWSGLRPATQDLLPVIGLLPGSRRLSIASGHYRNGILLAPGTAELLAAAISGERTSDLLAPFAPGRFLPQEAVAQPSL